MRFLKTDAGLEIRARMKAELLSLAYRALLPTAALEVSEMTATLSSPQTPGESSFSAPGECPVHQAWMQLLFYRGVVS